MPLLRGHHGLGIQEARCKCHRLPKRRAIPIRPHLRTMLQSCPRPARRQNLCWLQCNRISIRTSRKLDPRIHRARFRTPGSLRIQVGCRSSKLFTYPNCNQTNRALAVNNCPSNKSLEVAKAPQKLIHGTVSCINQAQLILDRAGPTAFYWMTEIAAQLSILTAAHINGIPTKVSAELGEGATPADVVRVVVKS